MTKQFVFLARAEDIPEGQVRIFEAGDEKIAVCRSSGQLYAVEDRCTHDDGPLGEGRLCGYEIECPRHGARFDIRDGAVRRMPAIFPVRVYPLRVENGDVLVELETE